MKCSCSLTRQDVREGPAGVIVLLFYTQLFLHAELEWENCLIQGMLNVSPVHMPRFSYPILSSSDMGVPKKNPWSRVLLVQETKVCSNGISLTCYNCQYQRDDIPPKKRASNVELDVDEFKLLCPEKSQERIMRIEVEELKSCRWICKIFYNLTTQITTRRSDSRVNREEGEGGNDEEIIGGRTLAWRETGPLF